MENIKLNDQPKSTKLVGINASIYAVVEISGISLSSLAVWDKSCGFMVFVMVSGFSVRTTLRCSLSQNTCIKQE